MPHQKITLATYITLSRFFLVPLFIFLFITQKFVPAFITLCVAAFTDLLDGFVARHFKMRTKLGAMLDPLADKFLMLLSFIALSKFDSLPWWLTLIVIGRDFLIMLGVGILGIILKIRLYYKPTRLSKLTTAFQILALTTSFFMVLIDYQVFFIPSWGIKIIEYAQTISIYTAALLTVVTFFQYTYIFYRFCKYGERKQKGGLLDN